VQDGKCFGCAPVSVYGLQALFEWAAKLTFWCAQFPFIQMQGSCPRYSDFSRIWAFMFWLEHLLCKWHVNVADFQGVSLFQFTATTCVEGVFLGLLSSTLKIELLHEYSKYSNNILGIYSNVHFGDPILFRIPWFFYLSFNLPPMNNTLFLLVLPPGAHMDVSSHFWNFEREDEFF